MSRSASLAYDYRVLIIDDTVAIHQDIRKILHPAVDRQFEELESAVLAAKPRERPKVSRFEIDSAYQGEEGVACVSRAVADGRPYALAFLDVRMPPGIDGLETMRRLWQVDKELQIVICTAFSDHSWAQFAAATGPTARLVILRKPFEPIEVMQLAHALTEKWKLEKLSRARAGELATIVVERTKELAESQMVFQLILEEKIQEARRDALALKASLEASEDS